MPDDSSTASGEAVRTPESAKGVAGAVRFGSFALTETANFSESSGFGQEEAGGVIDGYRLVEELGEGGFGVVWRAEQLEPIRREVALKVVKPGMDSREIIARFEAERQTLALMDHPNIAAVLDAGTTRLG